jgi:cytoskeletal protein RodZ
LRFPLFNFWVLLGFGGFWWRQFGSGWHHNKTISLLVTRFPGDRSSLFLLS